MTDTKTKTPTLYTLAEDLTALAEAVDIDPETGEAFGLEELDAAQAAFEDKAGAVAVAIRGAEAYAEGLKQYKMDIEKRQKAAERKVAALKDYLAANMEKAGMRRLDRIEARITLRDSQSVEVTDEELIPTEYKKIKWEVSKTAIKKAIESGQDVTGARIVTKTGVIIK